MSEPIPDLDQIEYPATPEALAEEDLQIAELLLTVLEREENSPKPKASLMRGRLNNRAGMIVPFDYRRINKVIDRLWDDESITHHGYQLRLTERGHDQLAAVKTYLNPNMPNQERELDLYRRYLTAAAEHLGCERAVYVGSDGSYSIKQAYISGVGFADIGLDEATATEIKNDFFSDTGHGMIEMSFERVWIGLADHLRLNVFEDNQAMRTPVEVSVAGEGCAVVFELPPPYHIQAERPDELPHRLCAELRKTSSGFAVEAIRPADD